jgi:uncharacterized protein (DUF1800 family)
MTGRRKLFCRFHQANQAKSLSACSHISLALVVIVAALLLGSGVLTSHNTVSAAISFNPGAAAGPEAWIDDLRPIGNKDWSYARAAHLLERAGFGGTPEEIQRLAGMTPQQAVAYLVDYEKLDQSHLSPFVESGIWNGMEAEKDLHPSFGEIVARARRNGQALGRKVGTDRTKPLWFQVAHDMAQYNNAVSGYEWDRAEIWLASRMLNTTRPLEEKMTLFWHGHFAVEERKIKDYRLLLQQFEMLRKNATGSFRDLLLGITRDPAMLIYLDGRRNVKADTNENYAREILELFGLGIGHYTETDIKEAARALTGWKVEGTRAVFNPAQFDDGEKTILGQQGKFNDADVVEVILKQPACADFIATKLYQFFSRAELAPKVRQELAQSLRANNYALKPALKRLFLSRDFYSPASYATQVKSPIQFMISTYKKLGLKEAPGLPYLPRATARMGQEVGDPPNVSGWKGDKDGGRAWLNPSTLLERGNITRHLLFPETARRLYFQKIPPPYKDMAMNALKAAQEGKGVGQTVLAGSLKSTGMEMSPIKERLARNEDHNAALGVYNGFLLINERVKDVPLTPAKLDLAALVKGAGAKTVTEAVDYLALRFLRLPLTPPDRQAVIAFLQKKAGGAALDYNAPQIEQHLRETLHLLFSAPEYQLS